MPAASPAEAREFIKRLVATQAGVAIESLHDHTCICGDVHLTGDDVFEIIDAIVEEFDADFTSYRWQHHHGLEEGCNPWLIFLWPWLPRQEYIPVRIADLIEAAVSGVWSVKYPEQEREW